MFGTDHYDLLDKFVKEIIAYNHFASHPKWAVYTIIEDKIRLFYVYFAHCFGLLKEFPAFLGNIWILNGFFIFKTLFSKSQCTTVYIGSIEQPVQQL